MTTSDLERACSEKLLLAFAGLEAGDDLLDRLRTRPPAGFTLFRALNAASPAQVRALTAALQAAAAGDLPLLIAADQEGGQLIAIPGTTPFPGNMALGAAGPAGLARRTGEAIGLELAAMGVNVNYAPVCDVNNNPANPVIGIRSFGEEPIAVARLCAAMVEGLQSAGVAAAAKHFPGHGDTGSDSHLGLPVLPHSRRRLAAVELPPFAAAIDAGARLVMSAHVALPALDGGLALPATLSPAVLGGLLRGELGFEGVVVSDALNMGAIDQGAGLGDSAVAAVRAGVDLLLCVLDADQVYDALLHAAVTGLLAPEHLAISAGRVRSLRRCLAGRPQPDLDVVACVEHRALAAEIAERSVTLVRDDAHLLPLRLDADARVAVVVPRPTDLTPADTSSYVTCRLASALRRHHAAVDEFLVPHAPADDEVAALAVRARDYDLVIAGTINASAEPRQAALVNALLATGVPLVAVALRLPYDLVAYPAAPTYLCTYSILDPSMAALARVLFGQIPFTGRLPVSILGLS